MLNGLRAFAAVIDRSNERLGNLLAVLVWMVAAVCAGVVILRYGFVALALPRLVGIASLGNVASQRVLTKIGLRRNGERAFPHPAYAAEGPMAWFERDRDEWLASSRQP